VLVGGLFLVQLLGRGAVRVQEVVLLLLQGGGALDEVVDFQISLGGSFVFHVISVGVRGSSWLHRRTILLNVLVN
jgi:hypothetical protein